MMRATARVFLAPEKEDDLAAPKVVAALTPACVETVVWRTMRPGADRWLRSHDRPLPDLNQTDVLGHTASMPALRQLSPVCGACGAVHVLCMAGAWLSAR